MITLTGRVLLTDGQERDCIVQFDDVGMLTMTPAMATAGDHVVCHVSGLGVIEGIAEARTSFGQELRIQGTPSHVARLAARMAWHRRKAADQSDQRGHDRIVPTAPDVLVQGASVDDLPGRLLDLSATGAALRLPVRPEVGAAVVVGRRRATVVRHLEDGIAVAFVMPLRPQDVVPEIVL